MQTMKELELAGRVAPEMDVCDIAGTKVGTVARIHQKAGGASHERIMEVRSGFLALGSHFYIPVSAVQDMTDGCIFLGVVKDAMDELGWHNEPADLEVSA